jgi:hypothetical protein
MFKSERYGTSWHKRGETSFDFDARFSKTTIKRNIEEKMALAPSVREARCRILIAYRCFSHVTGFTTSSRSGTITRAMPVRSREGRNESRFADLYRGFARCFDPAAGCARTFENRDL